jgi:cellulose synthase/poly-beta-1,6-N-acetylglucosamine synthase-like glycosyltransferase
VFRRDALLSIGGQAYGSVTEDYNTAMHLMASGFSSMYLNERLVFGMVPEDIPGGCRRSA